VNSNSKSIPLDASMAVPWQITFNFQRTFLQVGNSLCHDKARFLWSSVIVGHEETLSLWPFSETSFLRSMHPCSANATRSCWLLSLANVVNSVFHFWNASFACEARVWSLWLRKFQVCSFEISGHDCGKLRVLKVLDALLKSQTWVWRTLHLEVLDIDPHCLHLE